MQFDIRAFADSAVAPSDAPLFASGGIYALVLKEPAAIPGLTAGTDGILYVGMTDGGLEARNHFLHVHSGFSTVRRSLGALLKEKLGLKPVPRAPGGSRSNVVNYRFTSEGERALSHWMERNLLLAQQPLDGDIAAVEKDAIRCLEPPLNLTGWANPQRALIKSLRALCTAEAGKARN